MKKITLLFSISLLVSSLKAQVKNLGNFKINANSYVVATTAVVNTGATAVLTNDGTLRSTTAVTNNNTAIYKGSGTVTDALFTNNATVYVGNPLACLTFANAYTQTSVLQMDIGGTTACTQFDKINVTGTATLGGTLTVSSINGYSGTANDRLTLIQATALSGTFATVSLPTNWFINYNMPATGQVTLSYNTVLPVVLLNLKATPQYAAIQLDWQTAQEKNTSYFEIERSLDGQQFQTIGQVKAQGNSVALLNYAFLDQAPINGRNYYRLRQIDRDGTVIYSNSVAVVWGNKGKLTIFPSLATNKITIVSNLKQTYTLFDLLGREILRGMLETPKTEMDVSTLPIGIYFIKTIDEVGRFVKQN